MAASSPYILGLITARGGSKAIPRKNLISVGGRPLIDWTIESARKSLLLTSTALSTDSAEIADHALSLGLRVPFMRASALAQDESSHVEVVEDFIHRWTALGNVMPDYICLLQPTSPFRQAEDIDGAIELALERKAKACVSVCESKHHPMLSYTLDLAATLAPFLELEGKNLRRQELPASYVLNGALYIIQPSVLAQYRTFVPPGTIPYVMPQERSLDLDTPFDRHVAEVLLRHPFCIQS